jgi:hypothetical protein
MASDMQRIYLMQERRVVALNPLNGSVLATSPALGGEAVGAPTVCANQLFQLTTSTQSNAADRSQLVVLNRSDLSIAQQIAVNTPLIARPVAEGSHMFINVGQTTDPFASQDTIQAFRIRQ